MQTFTVTSPNTCGLVDTGSGAAYVGGVGLNTYAPDTATFSEYLTPEDAATAVLAMYPGYNVNLILGPLGVEPVNVSDPEITAYAGDSLTLHCEYSCTDPAATLTYAWSGPTGSLGIDGPTLILDALTEAYSGEYSCEVTATKTTGQTGSASNPFALTVEPPLEPSGVINAARRGFSALDLAPSYFPVLNNMPAGVDESGLELYVPGTDTVIPYDSSLPDPFRFDSAGDCFAPSDFRLVIRVAATSQVLATVYPPAGDNQNILWLYNPVVPS